ncbi:MAG: class F sortase, partial [Oscillochloris sp.]|nr:class F sortase [Oscillochloris sp.]
SASAASGITATPIASAASGITATPIASAASGITETPALTDTPIPSSVAVMDDPVRLVIAAIGLDQKLASVGLDSQYVPIVPNHEAGWYNLSARPGQGENIVLWGHVLRFTSTPDIPAPFARIKELEVGAEVILYDTAGTARHYTVTNHVWATPDQVQYILPQGREMLTMVSCIGDKVIVDDGVEMTHRLITIAEPVGD